MNWILVLQNKAEKQLDKLERKPKDAIIGALLKIQANPRYSGAEKLAELKGYRVRVGKLRIQFTLSDDKITVFDIRKRSDNTYR